MRWKPQVDDEANKGLHILKDLMLPVAKVRGTVAEPPEIWLRVCGRLLFLIVCRHYYNCDCYFAIAEPPRDFAGGFVGVCWLLRH